MNNKFHCKNEIKEKIILYNEGEEKYEFLINI